MSGEHRVMVDQTHRASGAWEIVCTCGWVMPFVDDDATREAIRAHLMNGNLDRAGKILHRILDDPSLLDEIEDGSVIELSAVSSDLAASEALCAALRRDVQELTAERDALLRERERYRKRLDLWAAVVRSAYSGLGDLLRGLERQHER